MTDELSIAIATAQKAGAIIMEYFQREELPINTKADQYDLVTLADTAADEFIRETIAKSFPGDLILSEENPSQPDNYKGRVWMVDPLDGTKDFIAGRDTFSVLVGLLVDNIPTVGVVFMPARDELFYAVKGTGAFRKLRDIDKAIAVSDVSSLYDSRMSVRLPSKEVRPLDAAIDSLNVKEYIAGGSIGSRVCDIASNNMDVFINTNHRASKWDTLACEVILNEAGGLIIDFKGRRLDYSQPAAKWNQLFVVASTEALARQTIHLLLVK